MISHTTERFRKLLDNLPEEIKKQANQSYIKFQDDPYQSGLHFKRIHSKKPIFSIRITKDYRSLGVLQEREIIWFWIGSHSDYDKMLKGLK